MILALKPGYLSTKDILLECGIIQFYNCFVIVLNNRFGKNCFNYLTHMLIIRSYVNVKKTFNIEPYLPYIRDYKGYRSKFRLSSHDLRIEMRGI
jgi:hypothetical protein